MRKDALSTASFIYSSKYYISKTRSDLPTAWIEPESNSYRCAGSPDWILFDFFYWIPRVAAGLGVHCAYVSLVTATANAFMWPAFLLAIGDWGHRVKPEVMATQPRWTPFPTSLAYRRHEALQVLHDMVELRGLGVSGAFRLGSSLSGCDVVTVRSCPVLEPEWLSLLGWLCGKPVLPLGHFPPAAMKHDAAGSFTEGNDFFRWLGKREVRSVVYVSFGSELLRTREQAHTGGRRPRGFQPGAGNW
ncbi:UDP-glycosyltransferase 91C1-like [Musa acuminata AAA Group]|uniref:UDP-glycosyltransferase 91C1-like n=1 Tax=Musa acuminata AAA Group TaxID=214697 RepID=UPI0031D610B8